MLTPGDYGTFVAIMKSVSITNDGAGEAGVAPDGITINAGVGDVVGLRGLIIDGGGTGDIGIEVTAVSALHVQNCVIRNFEAVGFGYGIRFHPITDTQLFLSDTLIYNNGSGANSGGIWVLGHKAIPNHKLVLNRVQFENNVFGLKVDGSSLSGGTVRVIVRDSVFSGNAGDGIIATNSASAAGVVFMVDGSSFVNNGGTGVLANGQRATILLNDNVITGNGTGISAISGGQLISYGNNKNNNNVGPEGTPTSLFSQM